MPVNKADRIIVDENFKPTNVEEYFDFVVFDTVKKLTDELHSLDKDQPGKLIQSIGENSFVTKAGNKISFQIGMEDYWKFVDAGVDGTSRKWGSKYKFKPDGKPINLEAVKNFIAVRGIKLNSKKIQKRLKNKKIKKALKQVNRDKALKQASWAIGRAIKKHGIKPTHFLTGIINDQFKLRIKNDLSVALKKDVEIVFKELKKELE